MWLVFRRYHICSSAWPNFVTSPSDSKWKVPSSYNHFTVLFSLSHIIILSSHLTLNRLCSLYSINTHLCKIVTWEMIICQCRCTSVSHLSNSSVFTELSSLLYKMTCIVSAVLQESCSTWVASHVVCCSWCADSQLVSISREELPGGNVSRGNVANRHKEQK